MWKCVTPEGICRLVYIDTDSLYYEGPEIDFSSYNGPRIRRANKNGVAAKDAKGKPHYMGILEFDTPIDRFKTWGAKKYMYQRGGEIKLTLSGVNKKLGAKELVRSARTINRKERRTKGEKLDAFDMFERGYEFQLAGGQEATYNDNDYGELQIDGKSLYVTANLYLEDGSYTLGITSDYSDIIDTFQRKPHFCEKVLDLWKKFEYN